MRHNTLIIILIILISNCKTYAQSQLKLDDAATLNRSFNRIISSNSDDLKILENKNIKEKVKRILSKKESIEYDFKEVKNIGSILSQDGKVRIITWNLLLDNDTYRYFGFIQTKNKNFTNTRELIDNTGGIKGLKFQTLPTTNWYGCLYYKIITTRHKGEKLYTLLGWDGNFRQVKRRYIDILTINNNAYTLGKSIFQDKNGLTSRVIFNFSKKASLILKYEDRNERIICDRLAPYREDQRRDFRHYYPVGSIMDAYEFKNGLWIKKRGIKNK